MEINGYIFDCSLIDVLTELHSQLLLNGIDTYFSRGFKESGNNIMTSCLYHGNGQERHPSLGFHKDTGICHCFTCGETHTLPEVISYCFGRDDPLGVWGWNWLMKNFLSVSVENRKPLELNISRETKKKEEKIEYISEEELDSYRYYHPYMYKRKLDDRIINMFDIGYDEKSQCITMPIRDLTGRTITIARRSVNTKWFNYPVDVVKPLYGIYELSQLTEYPKEVYVCESILDCLFLWVCGKYSVAMNGLGSSYQYKQLEELPCRTLVLATDNDNAGLNARKKLKKMVKNKIILEIDIPKGKKDINDLTKEEVLNLKPHF